MNPEQTVRRLEALRPRVQRRSTRLQQQQFFYSDIILLPTAIEQLERYLDRLERSRSNTAPATHIQAYQTIDIRYRFSELTGPEDFIRSIQSTVLIEQVVEDLQTRYYIPSVQSGELLPELIFDTPRGSAAYPAVEETNAYQNSSYLLEPFSFSSLQEVASLLQDYVTRLEENGGDYMAISLQKFALIFRFPLRSLVQTLVRGGGMMDVIYAAIPTALLLTKETWPDALYKYKEWSTARSLAVKFGYKYKKSIPDHLKDMRGLWVVPGGWVANVCGIVAFLYGWRLASAHTTLLDVYYETPSLLVEAAQDMQERHDIEVPMRLQSFEQLIEDYANTYELIIYDHMHMPLFTYRGSECTVPKAPFDSATYPLTVQRRDAIMKKQICLFIDIVSGHYLPIFDIGLFFSKRVQEATAAKTRAKSTSSCPICYVNMRDVAMKSHTCHFRKCLACSKLFDSYDAYKEHQPEDPFCEKRHACRHCGLSMYNNQCCALHEIHCRIYQKPLFETCNRCYRRIDLDEPEPHKCMSFCCALCGKWQTDPKRYDLENKVEYFVNHPCPMNRQSAAKLKGKTTSGCYAFDFESMLRKAELRIGSIDRDIYYHDVNYVCAQKLGSNENASFPTLAAFWSYVVEQSKEESTMWFAHNFKGYDGRILLDYLETQNVAPVQLILAGDKIMNAIFAITVGHDEKTNLPIRRQISFRDSLNHFACSLERLPKMFGLESEGHKGFFPYKFNTIENSQYVGTIPGRKWFGYDSFLEDKKREFDAWYAEYETNGRRYDFAQELAFYCKLDTLILRRALEEYQKVGLELTEIDPLRCVTIASYAYKVYTDRFRPNDTLYYLDYSFDTFARKAFHGGKTDVRCMLYEQTEEDRAAGIGLRYVDIQSLYPTVQYFDPMPCGMPTTETFSSTRQPAIESLLSEDDFFGFIECDMLPIRFMFHPTLCAFQDGKLMATLNPLKKVVLTSAEFQYALNEKRYACTHVYRIDRYQKTKELFRGYMELFLKIKITNGGLKQCYKDDPASFEAYARSWKEHCNIDLSPDDFQHNPPMRELAKLLCNSLWGKFGERNDRPTTEVLTGSKEIRMYYKKIVRGDYIEMRSRRFGQFYERKQYRHRMPQGKRNIAVAAFVTAHARLRLQKELDNLETRVYYHDTDSIIYKHIPGEYAIDEGPLLGDWASETGSHLITRFVSIAPKTYAYTSEYKGDVIKAKGFTMNGTTQRIVTFGTIKKMITDTAEAQKAHIDIPTTTFQHLVDEGKMITYETLKQMNLVYNKGVVERGSFRVYPHGIETLLGFEANAFPIQNLFTPLLSVESNVDRARRLENYLREKMHQDDCLFTNVAIYIEHAIIPALQEQAETVSPEMATGILTTIHYLVAEFGVDGFDLEE